MRILNRPMFRYGGPIKEGIMQGMRNGGRIGFKDGTEFKNPYPQWKFGETGFGKTLKYLNPKPIIDDTFNLTANQLSKFFTGYNPGLSYKKSKRLERDMWDKMKGRDPLERTGRMTDDEVNKVFFTSAKKGWTTPSMQEGPSKADLELAALKKKIAAEAKGTMPGNLGTEPWVNPNKATDLAKKQQQERIQNYLDMMGYDSAKKGAMSKALIDASALVQNASTEAGSLKHADWGNLINKAIQTTSKRLEKPEQIREAVGLMATKAAIQKDMEDPEAKELRRLNIKKVKKELKGNSFTENKVITAKSMPGQPGYDAAVEITEGTDFKGNLVASDEWVKALEKMTDDADSKGLNEKQLIEKYTNKLIEDKGYQDGHYTVGDNLVTIKDSIVIDVE